MGFNPALEHLGTRLSWEQQGNYLNEICLDKPTHSNLKVKPTPACIEMAGWTPYNMK